MNAESSWTAAMISNSYNTTSASEITVWLTQARARAKQARHIMVHENDYVARCAPVLTSCSTTHGREADSQKDT
jgi:hypothetical protein